MAKMVDRIRKALGIPARIQGAAYTDEWWGDVPPAASSVMYGVELAYAGTDAVRTPTHGVPALFQDLEEEDDTDWEAKLREAKARAAAPAVPKAVVEARPPAPVVAAAVKPAVPAPAPVIKAPASSVAATVRKSPFAKKLDFVDSPKKPDVASKKVEIAPKKKTEEREPTLKGIPTARIPATPAWMEDDWGKAIQRAKDKSAKTSAAAPREEEDWEALIRRAKSAAV